jgi:hypothetical protein
MWSDRAAAGKMEPWAVVEKRRIVIRRLAAVGDAWLRREVEGQVMAFFNASDEESFDKMREMFGPTQVDQQIRQAIHFCWMGLPKEKRNVDELERQVRRLVDRAFRDVREDFDEFFGNRNSP